MMNSFKRFISMLILIVMLFSTLLPTSVFATESGEGTYTPLPAAPAGTTEYPEEQKGLLGTVESWFSALLNGIANALNFLVSVAIGERVIIDDLVFNEYPPTKIDYFVGEGTTGESTLIWGEGDEKGLSETVNSCYNLFRRIAIMVYMVMLVYMGLRIMIATTGQSVSHYKSLFMYWVIGVAILFLYPHVMKYVIKLNDAFVSVISENRSQYKISPEKDQLASLESVSMVDISFEENPFDSSGTDYMSQISRDANEGKRLAISFTYLILTWQLITLIVHYYKRVFMVGFLIAIFPIVATFYAIDKIGDGKSQAFDHWNKEFILNVLIQSFHAIVYVFVCGSVYASYGNETGIDYVLVIVGSTFLFTGEEIIKIIFSQNSPAGGVRSLKDTAAATMAKVAVAKSVATAVTKPIIGKDSMLNKTINAYNQYKVADRKEKVFENMATTMSSPNTGLRLDHTQGVIDAINNDSSLSDEEKRQARADAVHLANAVSDINNPNTRSVEELQSAYATVQDAMRNDPNNAILQDLNLTEEQIAAMAGAGAMAANLLASGVTDSMEIDRRIRMELGYVLNGMSDEAIDKYKNMVLLGMAMHGASRYGNDPENGVISELDRGVDAIRSTMDSFVASDDIDSQIAAAERNGNAAEKARLLARKEEIKRRRAEINAQARVWAQSFHEEGETASKKENQLAHSMYVIAHRHEGLFSTREYFDAANTIKSYGDTSDATKEMTKALDMDVDLLRHMLAAKADAEGKLSGEERRNIVYDYEKHSRDGLYDDELSGHQLIMLATERDDTKRTNLRDSIIESMTNARIETNEYERDATQAIAEDILASTEVDIEEGGISKTRFLNGQTRERILEEKRQAKKNLWMNLAGYGNTQETGTFSDEYLEAVDTYNAHFTGDQE